ncbi:putative methyltransferase C9orf114 [Corticium candelabrum]|uniref:putative methyltransferase C9orf114 n=1 Tax=Corticium candelabrum TaxID=121492 RepID=UPI002E35D21B|nr:putative methyltransferase C9orf114 [Corticium candelabrum]
MPKKKRKLSDSPDDYSSQETNVRAKQRRKEKRRKKLERHAHEQQTRDKQDTIATDTIDHVVDKTEGRHFTVSVAVPGSILDNAQSDELRTYLAGQIARSIAIFNIDEIIIFDDGASIDSSVKTKRDSIAQMANILQYLETPQYLRKQFFPMHRDLQYAGLLNPLDTPHHMRVDEELPFREGIVLDRPVKQGKGSFANCGTRKDVCINRHLLPGTRVTVRMTNESKKNLKGEVVSPSIPRTELGLYWGYTLRIANGIGDVFAGAPFKDGYDLTLGTSERGISIDDLQLRPFTHLLIVFGGVKGLEAALEADERLHVSEVGLLFDYYVNTCPNQGSRTIRTEEALLISMSAFRPHIDKWSKCVSYA